MRLGELGVRRLIAARREHAQLRLALVQRLRALVQATREAIVDHRVLQNILECGLNVHRGLLLSGNLLHGRVSRYFLVSHGCGGGLLERKKGLPSPRPQLLPLSALSCSSRPRMPTLSSAPERLPVTPASATASPV